MAPSGGYGERATRSQAHVRFGWCCCERAYVTDAQLCHRLSFRPGFMHDNIELLRGLYKRFKGRDIDGVIDAMAENVVWANAMEGGHERGRKAGDAFGSSNRSRFAITRLSRIVRVLASASEKPSRSIHFSICAIGGCSILAKRARSRCVCATPSRSATSTGICPTPRWSSARASRGHPRGGENVT